MHIGMIEQYERDVLIATYYYTSKKEPSCLIAILRTEVVKRFESNFSIGRWTTPYYAKEYFLQQTLIQSKQDKEYSCNIFIQIVMPQEV